MNYIISAKEAKQKALDKAVENLSKETKAKLFKAMQEGISTITVLNERHNMKVQKDIKILILMGASIVNLPDNKLNICWPFEEFKEKFELYSKPKSDEDKYQVEIKEIFERIYLAAQSSKTDIENFMILGEYSEKIIEELRNLGYKVLRTAENYYTVSW